ncbi:hypothetical protein MC885_006373, partial [Smutsia gigantea]
MCSRWAFNRIRSYFSDMLNSLDAVIIVVTLLVDIVYIFYDFKVLKDVPRTYYCHVIPISGKVSFYRNPIKVKETMILSISHYRVHRMMIDDHNVPSLSEMLTFTKEVDEWMAQDNENIVVIHCKGGKGK